MYESEDIKRLLTSLHEQRRASDPIYVYYGAAAGAMYYANETGFSDGDLDFGDCHRADTRSYFRELDGYRGRRFWLVMQHAIARYRERDDILRYLNTIGTARASIVVPSTLAKFPIGAAEAYLYDLRDPRSLPGASAGTFPILGLQILDPALPCGGSADPPRPRRTGASSGPGHAALIAPQRP